MSEALRIKICGVRDADTAIHAAACGADYVGLNFVEASPRFVGEGFDAMGQAIRDGRTGCRVVGLFADAEVEYAAHRVRDAGLDVVQLHGQEPTSYVAALRSMLGADVAIWKALPFDVSAIDAWRKVIGIDVLLLDAPHVVGELGGGTGRTLDWSALSELDRGGLPPIMLAGGLTPENVGDAISEVGREALFGVDVSSGVEVSRGVKDPQRIKAFCDAVHHAERHAE